MCECLYTNIRLVCFYLGVRSHQIMQHKTVMFYTLVCAREDVNSDRVCAFRFFVIYADSPEGTRRVTIFVT